MKRLLVILALCLFSATSIAQDKHFKRQEKFPAGEQTSHLIGSFFSGMKDYNVVQYVFDAPYEKVWPAVKRAARHLNSEGNRPIAGIDEDSGRIQSGKITQDAMIGMGPGAWMDEFIIEAKKADTKTKVTVARKVVEKEMTGARPWRTQWSNGKIEQWLLSQVEDEIKNNVADEAAGPDVDTNGQPIDYSKTAPGKYSSKTRPNDYLELNADGTFFLQERGKGYAGTYRATGSELTIILSEGSASKARFVKGNIIDDEGELWIKKEGAVNNQPSSPSSPNVAAGVSEVLTNADILRMVQAKLSDVLIIGKIKTSKHQFDTSTDALIKLKQAGASDEVIQALIETSR